ncbi:hypothetical protein J2795_001705 [Chryseobacterium bernardetii]|jgi:hypothetical protein|uniref:Uncharacterized protein n=2 Tax=Chryseobacterium TaxID=59732 RepID=A0A543EIC6_9FLAO|nr:hypothetical protein [Chryseobacterium vietnamense]MDR6441005.1 hypothetical protein [Chryseobacterium bernardetii]TQM21315.1 hypothetical protein FB551_1001 [Chryseobacterium aquifrigidense]
MEVELEILKTSVPFATLVGVGVDTLLNFGLAGKKG